jgi:hypothetical protein
MSVSFEGMTNKNPSTLYAGMTMSEYMDWMDFLEGDIDEDELRRRQDEQ